MKKCKWENGIFYPCDNFDPRLYDFGRIEMICHACNVRIEKPKNQLIVKQSGKTFVAKCDGVDYLCVKTGMYETPEAVIEDAKQRTIPLYHRWWKSIDEIESEGITDEIAMLRPIMIDDETNTLYTLWGYDVGFCVTGNGCIPAEELRIARVGDLP